MCSDFLQTMENFQGDLADIFQPNIGTTQDDLPTIATAQANLVLADWNLFQSSTSTDPILETPLHDFGHPFNTIGDPLLEELDMLTGPSLYGNITTNTGLTTEDPFGGRKIIVDGQDHQSSDHQRLPHNRSHNIFSRMLQISPNNVMSAPSSSLAPSASLLLSNDMINVNTSSKGCLVENTGLQISSPRNTGIKRRKSQAKKVVCIPAPAPVNSRPTGEVVPSDLWAWRKYGQKPIKGSPYPRGYYRCSSSKGCSARKQVERSRTDPNMLVITYTSEHNHPWPTQRNALAGSTRNQPSKTTTLTPSKTSPPRPTSQSQKDPSFKEEHNDLEDTNMILSSGPPIEDPSQVGVPLLGRKIDIPGMERQLVKEEMEDELEKEMELDDVDGGGGGGGDLGFPPSYRPALPESNSHHQHHHHHHHPDQDFFADLGEIAADPLNHLLFSQGFSGVEDRENSNKSLDPFSFYDWPATGNHNNNSNNSNSSSFGTEAKRLGGL